MRNGRVILVALAILNLTALAGLAAAQALGSEFQVNTYTTGNQKNTFGDRAVAADASGNFIVVWQSQQDGILGIFGQRYDSAGRALGAEFRVNSYTTGYLEAPAVAADASGNFVVVWWSHGQDGSNSGIFGQRYDSAGQALGTEFRVNSYTPGSQSQAAIASDANGNFVVVWQNGTAGANVHGQRFDSTGAAQGAEFRVNTRKRGTEGEPTVASDPSGNFVVVWVSGDHSYDTVIAGQRYDSTGVPEGEEFLVTKGDRSASFAQSVASDAGGNFVVVWNRLDTIRTHAEVYGQRYDSAGVPQGGRFRVNSYTPGPQDEPSVSADPSGAFVVVWNGMGSGEPRGIFGQRYDSSGVPQGGQFQVNSYTSNTQFYPSVATTGTGEFVVAWTSYGQDGSGEGMFGRRFGFVAP